MLLGTSGCVAMVPYEPRFPEAARSPLVASLSLTDQARANGVDDHGWSLLRIYEFASECPEESLPNLSTLAPGHRGVLELFDGLEAGPAGLPVGHYVVLRGEYMSPGALSIQSCWAVGSFVPQPDEDYRAIFELGTGSCRLRLENASSSPVRLGDLDQCQPAPTAAEETAPESAP